MQKCAMSMANKAPINIILIYEKHYIDGLKIELGLYSSQGNPTYTTATTLSKEEIIEKSHVDLIFY